MNAERFPVDGRWACPKCSRFIATDAIDEWDELDAGAYYGIAERYGINCPRCGRLTDGEVLPPRWIPIRWGVLDLDGAA